MATDKLLDAQAAYDEALARVEANMRDASYQQIALTPAARYASGEVPAVGDVVHYSGVDAPKEYSVMEVREGVAWNTYGTGFRFAQLNLVRRATAPADEALPGWAAADGGAWRGTGCWWRTDDHGVRASAQGGWWVDAVGSGGKAPTLRDAMLAAEVAAGLRTLNGDPVVPDPDPTTGLAAWLPKGGVFPGDGVRFFAGTPVVGCMACSADTFGQGIPCACEKHAREQMSLCRGATVGCHDASCAKEAGHVVAPAMTFAGVPVLVDKRVPGDMLVVGGSTFRPVRNNETLCAYCLEPDEHAPHCTRPRNFVITGIAPARPTDASAWPKREAKPDVPTRWTFDGEFQCPTCHVYMRDLATIDAHMKRDHAGWMPAYPDGALRTLPDPASVWNAPVALFAARKCARCSAAACMCPREAAYCVTRPHRRCRCGSDFCVHAWEEPA